jgi:hypothetical protein
MSRRIQLTVLESGVIAVAELYHEDAPQTSAAMWQMLATPYEARTLHGIFEGRKITLETPSGNRNFNPGGIPAENTTAYPVAGDLLWKYFPPRAVRGMPNGLWDVMVIYGPEVILKNPLGIYACNLWAHIIENLDAFIAECADVRVHGAKTIRLSRLEQ